MKIVNFRSQNWSLRYIIAIFPLQFGFVNFRDEIITFSRFFQIFKLICRTSINILKFVKKSNTCQTENPKPFSIYLSYTSIGTWIKFAKLQNILANRQQTPTIFPGIFCTNQKPRLKFPPIRISRGHTELLGRFLVFLDMSSVLGYQSTWSADLSRAC